MRKRLFWLGVLLSAPLPALGHGVQVQITFNPTTGKIETREIVHTATRPNVITDAKRVYVMAMQPQVGGAGDGWYTRPDDTRNIFNVPLYLSGPGLTHQYDEASQLPGTGWAFSGSSTLPNLQNTAFGYTFVDGLKVWNGASFVDPGAEQLQIMRGDASSAPAATASTSDSGPFASMALSSIASQSTNAHSSISYRLLGDGIASSVGGALDGDDGIYLLSLQLSSTASGVGNSETFYYIMNKNQPHDAALAAAASLGFSPSLVQVVPEPASAGALIVIGMLAAGRRGRR